VSDVYIVGVGIHPFGRTEQRSGRQQGEFAIRAALSDAGVEWSDPVAYGGSDSAGSADTLVDSSASRAYGSSMSRTVAQPAARRRGRLRGRQVAAVRPGLAVGDKHPRGAFDPLPAQYGLPAWYGEVGLMLTTQFFAMKLRRYMDQFGITPLALARVSESIRERRGRSTRGGAPRRHRHDSQCADDQ
jgi:acetyl-CoA acetyltransferase